MQLRQSMMRMRLDYHRSYGVVNVNKPEGTLLDNVNSFYGEAIGKMKGVDQKLVEIIKMPQKMFKSRLMLRKENGQLEYLNSFRCHHSSNIQPSYGGLRYKHDLTLHEIQGIAFLNSIKSAVQDIPFGGSCGGISINPKNYTQKELEVLTRSYTRVNTKKGMIGSDTDIVGPEMGTSDQEMVWITDSYQKQEGHNHNKANCIATGKPLHHGGVQGQMESVGLGTYYAINQLLGHSHISTMLQQKYGLDNQIEGKTFIMQGFGNLGYQLSKQIYKNGGKIIGIHLSDGGIYNPDGIIPDHLYQVINIFRGKSNKLQYYQNQSPNTEYYHDQRVLFKECDYMIPAGNELIFNSVHYIYDLQKNVQKLNCKVVIEAANGPLSFQAEKVLNERGITVFPDVLINSGFLAVAYYEYIKNLQKRDESKIMKKWEEKSNMRFLELINELGVNSFTKEQLTEKHKQMMGGAKEIDLVLTSMQGAVQQAVQNVVDHSINHHVSLREACYQIAFTKYANDIYENGFLY